MLRSAASLVRFEVYREINGIGGPGGRLGRSVLTGTYGIASRASVNSRMQSKVRFGGAYLLSWGGTLV